ncbi:F0F1 ATP synthase subunit B family protein [Wolbachia endosymbiont of Dirofilaria (Dirofilaria) immitis]|uniref:F0F1 ATP synthase subunit B family protein n=1 Tax=Wolbachia endosymbiont of Dirofilaria (Dirofilaria) immitis TaxID=1812115 RepID=UPI00158EBF3B|nr:hypothetical protein [Wolbachia endosymbiont of Dirofilaria (Dirofilaria) immitis]QKX02114.1 hypothetical protein GOY12_00750 [Wolbachia endosymbiont of Dirofilaria (Dirofilaria) immitis]
MPQLDVSTFFSQVFWFLIFFSSLFFIVNFLFLPKLDEIINTRSKKVLDSFNSSICLLKLIENQAIRYNLVLNEAKMQAKKAIDNALVQVEEMRISMKNTIEEENKKMNKLVEEKVAKFKSKYINELKQMATGIALIYYNKLTNSEIEEEFVTNLIFKEF